MSRVLILVVNFNVSTSGALIGRIADDASISIASLTAPDLVGGAGSTLG